MKKLLFLVLFIPTISFSQLLEPDKRLHALYGAGISLYAGSLSAALIGKGDWRWFAIGGLGGYTVAALTKEGLDSTQENNFWDWKDIGAGYISSIPISVGGALLWKHLTKPDAYCVPLMGKKKRFYRKVSRKLSGVV